MPPDPPDVPPAGNMPAGIGNRSFLKISRKITCAICAGYFFKHADYPEADP